MISRIGIGISVLALLFPIGNMVEAQAGANEARLTEAAQKISKAAIANRYALSFDGRKFSGPAWEKLVQEGRQAQFFLIGEEHGIAENPKLAAAIFTELAKFGYSKIVVETSPYMAQRLDDASNGGTDGIRKLFAEPGGEPAFFGMQEEAEFVADAKAALTSNAFLFWGVDYEVISDRQLLSRLEEKKKPDAAKEALAKIRQASDASWTKYEETRGPQYIFSFAGDPALVQTLRASWPDRDAETSRILHTLEETLTINRMFMSGQNWPSNQRRADLIRANFLDHWNRAKASGETPKLMVKMGASHLVRGRSFSEAYDLGALLPEIAVLEGGSTFSIMVLPGKDALTAVFNPTDFSFQAAPAKDGYAKGLEPILAAAMEDQFTLIDLRPLRSVVRSGTLRDDKNLLRTTLGFDMLLIMSGSTASAELDHD
jgi:hypothetical protein